MIINFEKQTKPLTEKEMEALPIAISVLLHHRGKENCVCNRLIRESLRTNGYEIAETGTRKIINHIRNKSLIEEGLCSCSKGYFVANSEKEMVECILSLSQRIERIQAPLNALIEQKKKRFGESLTAQ